MTTIQSVNPDKASSLEDLNTIIIQNENGLGPLASVGNADGKSVLGFDLDQQPPATHAILALGDAPTEALCSGKVFVAGTLTSVYATR